mmetsp:Transcript_75083/g.125156  ORF Transcript_75083/g.125156 Transcript_75083/m.125156 type:complete len:514 (-) Transcript_75083:277-1818(-)
MRLFQRLCQAVGSNLKHDDRVFCVGTTCMPRLTERATGKLIPLPGAAGIAALLAISSPAQFGLGGKNVRDLSVRRVQETEQVDVDWPGLNAVLAEVAHKLPIGPTLRLEARLHKVLTYSPGDHFDSFHADSKRDPAHFCSLAVDCGTGAHCEGGEVEFSQQDGKFRAEKAGDWCCWFAAQPHRVRPVIRGHRVVALFNVLAHEECNAQRSTSAGVDDEVTRLLAAPELAAELKSRDVSRVGFLLRHRYSLDGEREPPAWQLRGRDRALYQVAKATGLPVELATCELCFEYFESDARDPDIDPDVLSRVRIARRVTDPDEYDSLCNDAGLDEESRWGYSDEAVEVPGPLRHVAGTRQLSEGDASRLHETTWDCDEEKRPVIWPFRDVAWACDAREAERVDCAGEVGFGGPMWGNEAVFEMFWYQHTVMLVDVWTRDPGCVAPFAEDLYVRDPFEAPASRRLWPANVANMCYGSAEKVTQKRTLAVACCKGNFIQETKCETLIVDPNRSGAPIQS